MNRLLPPVRWRHLRWVLCAAVVPTLWACNSRKLATPAGGPSQVVQTKVLQSQNRQLDLIFMVDNSASMKPIQTKLAAQLPTFMQVLGAIPGGLPDLHVAVISSSLGAGAFGDVPGCAPGVPGDDGGKFQHKSGCGLNAGENYIKAAPGANNFTGNLSDVFSCIAQLGDGGCGFEHQFESMRAALSKSGSPSDPDNGGFFRQDAFLGIVMLTNEDDCSVPGDSELFNTSVATLADQPPLGGLWSYRCNEFGHKCDQAMPHSATGLPMTLTGCQSKENTDGKYHLVPVKDYVDFLKGAKDLEKLFVAIIGGPAAPYGVHARTAQTPSGTEMQPEISHSCTATDGTYADPGVRLTKFVTDLNGVFLPICANDFKDALTQIGTTLGAKLGVQCINGTPATNPTTNAEDCNVVLRKTTADNKFQDTSLEHCGGNVTGTNDNPCWQLAADPKCPMGRVLKLCYDANCGAAPMTTTTTNALVSCALQL